MVNDSGVRIANVTTLEMNYKSKEVKNSAILLTLACQYECLELIKFLIEQCGINANESIRSTYNHETKIPLIIVNETKIPLIIAIEMKNESMIKYLIEHGADVNDEYYVNECHGEGCCYYYSTPLITAIEEHLDKNLVEYLIEKGANVNYLESAYSCGNFEYEYTPLSIACDSLSIGEDDIIIDEIVECLVDHGADVNVQLQNRIHGMVTPLDIICINGNYESTKKYLIEHGAVANNNKYNN